FPPPAPPGPPPPVTPQLPVRAFGQGLADDRVQPLPLPVGHGDVVGERADQGDVLVGGVADLPVELPDLDHVEPAAGLDVVDPGRQFAGARLDRPARLALADLVVHLLQVIEYCV